MTRAKGKRATRRFSELCTDIKVVAAEIAALLAFFAILGAALRWEWIHLARLYR
jgi:hypothetical protein